MHEADLHDLSDDPDYFAPSIPEGLGRSMTGGASGSGVGGVGGGFNENEGSEVVYSKDNVAVHLTQYGSQRISGRLRLINQHSVLFLKWTPCKPNLERSNFMGSSSSGISEKDRNLYTIEPISLSDIRYIRRRAPPFGWQYIIVVLQSGIAFPPLYFYSGGVREFLATLRQHVHIIRSAEDANVFLVNDFHDPLQKSLSSLELPRAVSAPVSSAPSEEFGERQRNKAPDPARDISLQVLEKFSLITKFARETTQQIFHESQNNGLNAYESWKHDDPSIVKPVASAHIGPNKITDSPSPVNPAIMDSNKLNLIWGKPRQKAMASQEWLSFLDSEGRIIDSKSLRKRVFYGGVEHNLRKEVWKFLLGYYEYDSTYAERQYLVSVKKEEYNTIKAQWKNIFPAQAKRFTKYRERKGLIEKDVVRTDRSFSYYDGDDNVNVSILHDILLTYSFYNFDLGYCQGMSDLLSPILFVMEDESESFWCFVALMERLGPNFNRDQNGMHSQLFALSKLVELLDQPLHKYLKQADCLNYFFCFRWILIQFKREFEFQQVMHLWEVFWTHYLSEHFHLYVCVAILKKYRRQIIDEGMDFDTLLKFINELSGHIDIENAIKEAEGLWICAGEEGAACIPPGTPPSLPESDSGYYQQDEVL